MCLPFISDCECSGELGFPAPVSSGQKYCSHAAKRETEAQKTSTCIRLMEWAWMKNADFLSPLHDLSVSQSFENLRSNEVL